MKRLAVLAVVAVVALGLMPATAGAGASAGTGQVTIVHDATVNADTPAPNTPVTVCVDGEPIAGVDEPFAWGDILPPLTLPAGTYDVAVFFGVVPGCNSKTTLADELTVEPGDDITVAAIYVSSDGPELVVWPNDNSCYEPDTARLTVRHGAYTGGAVDVVATIGGTPTVVVEGLLPGDQAITDIPAPLAATDVVVTSAGNPDDVFIDLGPVTFEPGINYVVYAGGGLDGPAGAFVDPITLAPCVTPTTAPAPTTEAPAAAAVTAAPKFTG